MTIPERLLGELRALFGDGLQTGEAIRGRHASKTTWIAPEPAAGVPVSRVSDCIAKPADMGLIAPTAEHVGDGNFHHPILVDPADPGKADLAIVMEGTCTGEHGIGQGKRRYLAREAGPGRRTMTAIKAALDPQGIMRPGKILPDMPGPAA